MKGDVMKVKKRILVCIVFIGLCISTIIKSENPPSQEIERLKAEIKQLQTTIESLQKKISQLKDALADESDEKMRLLQICRKAGINVHIKDSTQSGEVTYRGKKRSKEWFDEMYKRFCIDIVCINGKYFDKEHLEFQRILPNKILPKGTVVKVPSGCKVLQALGNGEALVINKGRTLKRTTIKGEYLGTISRGSDTLFHLSGYEGQLIDEQALSYKGPLISTGTFEYTDTLEARRTIQSFRIFKSFYEPLTKEQFADALNSGYILTYLERRGRRTRITTVP
jgi:cell division protein FtsL